LALIAICMLVSVNLKSPKAQVLDSLPHTFINDTTLTFSNHSQTSSLNTKEYVIPAGLILFAAIFTLFLYNARSK
jgi:hypothetical protein